jgi:hypothetical protein
VEFIFVLKEANMKVSLFREERMDKVFTNLKMEINMRATGKETSVMVKEH